MKPPVNSEGFGIIALFKDAGGTLAKSEKCGQAGKNCRVTSQFYKDRHLSFQAKLKYNAGATEITNRGRTASSLDLFMARIYPCGGTGIEKQLLFVTILNNIRIVLGL